MDVIKDKRKKPLYQRPPVLVGITVIFLALLFFALNHLNLGTHSVPSHKVSTAQVKRGSFEVKVSAPGILVSRNPRWIASNVDARLEKIYMHPGDVVSKGDVIVELNNPEVERRAAELEWEYKATEREVHALSQRHKTQILDLEAQILNNKMQYDVEKLRLEAERQLLDEGNGTVSMIDHKARKLSVSELFKRSEIDKAQLKQLKLTLAAEFEAAEARLQRLQKINEQAEFEKESLIVRAPVDGIVQEMTLEPGQRVQLGENITRLANPEDLIAELSVPEISAKDIVKGQRVSVDTRFNKIVGEVIRVNPSVTNGIVQVDVELIGTLPQEVRADLSVSGEIFVSDKNDVLHVRRPSFAQAEHDLLVFKLNSNNFAKPVKVKFGIASSLEIEVAEGLNEGDEIIVSDTSEFSGLNEIKITQ